MAHPVQTFSGLLGITASCECGWESTARNALANAKRHSAAHGHVVLVNQEVGVTYAPAGLSRDEVFSRRRYASWES